MQPVQQDITPWRNSAPYWEKYRDIIRQMFAPVAQALVEDAGIASGHAVLDVATGPGEPALTIAGHIGPEGKIVGIDPAPEMVDAARRAAARLQLANAQFEVASADHLPFPDAFFDAATSRFGAMFFPSPEDAVREILRVLKPGGKFALAVWGFAERNPFFSAVQRVLDRFIEPHPPEPGAPDAFRFAAPGTLREIVAAAGAIAPSERLLEFQIAAPVSAAAFWKIRSEMSERLRAAVATLPAKELAEVDRLSVDAIGAYATDGGVSFPAEVLIVSAAKELATSSRGAIVPPVPPGKARAADAQFDEDHRHSLCSDGIRCGRFFSASIYI